MENRADGQPFLSGQVSFNVEHHRCRRGHIGVFLPLFGGVLD
jgi:hypothetical protein